MSLCQTLALCSFFSAGLILAALQGMCVNVCVNLHQTKFIDCLINVLSLCFLLGFQILHRLLNKI